MNTENLQFLSAFLVPAILLLAIITFCKGRKKLLLVSSIIIAVSIALSLAIGLILNSVLPQAVDSNFAGTAPTTWSTIIPVFLFAALAVISMRDMFAALLREKWKQTLMNFLKVVGYFLVLGISVYSLEIVLNIYVPAGGNMPKIFSPVARLAAAGIFVVTVPYLFRFVCPSTVMAGSGNKAVAQK